MRDYEDVLYGLLLGSGRLGLKPASRHDTALISQTSALLELWEETQKPILLRAMELSQDKRNTACEGCHSAIRANLNKVEALVTLLEKHHDKETKEFRAFGLGALVFMILASAISAFFVRRSVVAPVEKLSAVASELEKGRFDVLADVHSSDEIGRLGATFNNMVQGLKSLFDKRAEHLNEVLALANASVYLSSVPASENIHEDILNIAIKNFGLTMAWLGTIEEGNPSVKPIAQAGFEEDYLSSVEITWDDSPSGMGPTGMAIKTGKAQTMNDIPADPRYAPWKTAALKRGYQSSMAIPLLSSDAKVIGVLNLYSGKPGFFIERRVRLLQIFANQAATAIENAMLIHGLEEKVDERTREVEDSNLELQAINKELEMQRIAAEGARLVAESAEKAKGEFLANMSHELRTPINAILGFSQIMTEGMTGELTDKQTEYLKYIYESGTHLLSLINDILDLSKVEAGGIDLQYMTVDVRDLINRTLIFFKEKALNHGIRIDTEIEYGSDTLQADERRLKQVLLNLLSNAVKFTPDGGSIGIGVRRIKSSEIKLKNFPHLIWDFDFIEISVKDSGPGIKAEDIPKLFKPFQQLESTYEEKHQGTGLGLALCKRIVELHGGKIWIESEFGKGTDFKFVIPTVPLPQEAKPAGPIISPVTKILTWEYLESHTERVISFHKRRNLRLGLLRLDTADVSTQDDQAAFSTLLKKTIRKHEILAHGENQSRYYVVLLDVDRQVLDAAGTRIKNVLSEKGYAVAVKTVIYPDDGETLDELLAALGPTPSWSL